MKKKDAESNPIKDRTMTTQLERPQEISITRYN